MQKTKTQETVPGFYEIFKSKMIMRFSKVERFSGGFICGERFLDPVLSNFFDQTLPGLVL